MSRTDKTDPLWVRAKDPANRRFLYIHHDHTKRPCTLDQFDGRIGVTRGGSDCWMFLHMGCGCSSCSKRSWSNWHGASRAEWKQQQRAWLKGVGEDRVERDIPNYK